MNMSLTLCSLAVPIPNFIQKEKSDIKINNTGLSEHSNDIPNKATVFPQFSFSLVTFWEISVLG